jgi:predicted metal-dependent HD superfamily phosphohydrolase
LRDRVVLPEPLERFAERGRARRETVSDIGHWVRSWGGLGVGDSPALRQVHRDVLSRYAEAHRHYHTRQHLLECFEKIRDIIALAEHPAEVEIGLWFHDAIYDTRRHDNEERSADWARTAARELGASTGSAQRIHDLVMSTRHAAEPVGIDAQVLVDADLSILGAQPARFEEYEAQVRREYAWVEDLAFRSGRAKILKTLLDRPHLFCTDGFRQRYEAQARRNIQFSLARLGGSA